MAFRTSRYRLKNGTRIRLISKNKLESAIEFYPDDGKTAIAVWRKAIEDNDWESLEEVRQGYSQSVDLVCGYTILNRLVLHESSIDTLTADVRQINTDKDK